MPIALYATGQMGWGSRWQFGFGFCVPLGHVLSWEQPLICFKYFGYTQMLQWYVQDSLVFINIHNSNIESGQMIVGKPVGGFNQY